LKNRTSPAGKGLSEERDNIALLGAFCLFLSTIEYLIPKPLPFMRLGIANLPLMIGLDLLSFRAYLVLVLIKIVGQALVSGSLFSYIFLFSFAGTTASALIMFLLRRGTKPTKMSLLGIGVLGALTSNLSQVSLAGVFVFGQSALYIAPPFLGAGIVTGLGLGAFCEAFIGRSQWFAARLKLRGERSLPGLKDSSR